MSVVIDASVFVAAARASEPQYARSVEFLSRIQQSGEATYSPVLVLAECSGAIARATGDGGLADRAVALIQRFRGLQLVPLTLAVALRAAEFAAKRRLRGSDAIYVAVASELQAMLVTWDIEMLQRSGPATSTLTPQQWLDKYTTR